MVPALLLLPLLAAAPGGDVEVWIQSHGAHPPAATEVVAFLSEAGSPAEVLEELHSMHLGERWRGVLATSGGAWLDHAGACEDRRRVDALSLALEILGDFAGPSSWETLHQLAAFPVAESDRAEIETHYRAAVTQLAHREPASLRQPRTMSAPRELLPSLSHALARTLLPEAAPCLVNTLDRGESAERSGLQGIAYLARRASAPLTDPERRRIRFLLDSPSDRVRMAACQAVAALDDRAAVARLIHLVDDPSAGTRSTAFRALRELCAISLPNSARAWHSWHEGQAREWQERGPEALEHLQGGAAAERVSALRWCARQKLHVDELVGPIVALLELPDQGVVGAALATLQALRAEEALPAVEALQDHPTPWVALRAAETARRLETYRRARLGPRGN